MNEFSCRFCGTLLTAMIVGEIVVCSFCGHKCHYQPHLPRENYNYIYNGSRYAAVSAVISTGIFDQI